ncbi:PIG-L family deacetylase [Streptomycetaceae bacterium NBC_01309]
MSTDAPADEIQAPGTPEAAWRSWGRLGELPRVVPDPAGGMVVIAAHPDDEVLGVGGLMARVLENGRRLRVVLLTDGDASHPGGPLTPADLAQLRARESERALGALAPGAPAVEIARLGLPDTAVVEHEGVAVAALGGLLAGYELCLAPWSHDLHADHEAAGRIAARACRATGTQLAEYPVWMWHWAVPDDCRVPWERAVRVDLAPEHVARKERALGCFASQIAPLLPGDDDRVILPPEELAHFGRPFEVLFR